MSVTVALLKLQLNVDFDTDDDLLAHKIAAAEEWIGDYIGKPLVDFDPVPATLTEAVLQLAASWYENREAVVIGAGANEVPFGVKALIRPYWELERL
ncbi:head-tail connector protein [Mesorhizobium sp.]|uniref:head-tail connector protein n=1 Tax=Mesorhizobium sp. TaxID=1871066 RepID=UPI000FE52F2C|nr:head-tail connector protein [Mesorhizobium sp.]RWD80457.1 MAG: phage gp6-like head-tail connector protein [Mesorhizobium sp.]TIS37411.1 MAG: phage gp6-like head-tail connector protein [Mesorhizobium sp.]